jgi:hypothetical protein
MIEQEKLSDALNAVEKAQVLLIDVQAYNNIERFQQASLQLLLARKSLLDIDQQSLTENERKELKRAQELIKHLNDTKEFIQSE